MGSTSTHDLPPGYRFYPTEEELVGFYLLNKLEGRREDELNRVIPVQDISCVDPWELPNKAGEKCRRDQEQWFFFNPQQEKEANGGRPSRITTSGYWKATGSPSVVYSSQNQEIGMKKTMVFYKGKAPVGKKTKWKVNEYKAIARGELPRLRQEYSVCRVFVGSGCCMSSFDRRPLPTQPIMNNTIPPNQPQQLATPMFGGHEMLEENNGGTSSTNLDFLPSQEPRDQSPTNDTSSSGGFQSVDDGGMDELLQSILWDDSIAGVLSSIEHRN